MTVRKTESNTGLRLLIFVVRTGYILFCFFFFQAEDGIRDVAVTGVQTCALPISGVVRDLLPSRRERDRVVRTGASFADRARAPGIDRFPPVAARARGVAGRVGYCLEALPRSGLLHLPHSLCPEPPRPALRHRSRRSRRVVDPGEELLVLERD